jgi:hypothetical protein
VADHGAVVGVPDLDALLLRVDDVAFNLCAPPVTVVLETITIDGHDVVVLQIPKGDHRPYSTKDGRYYVRSGARCRSASREELLRLFQASRALFYDEQALPWLTQQDLDLDEVSRYLAATEQVDLGEDLPGCCVLGGSPKRIHQPWPGLSSLDGRHSRRSNPPGWWSGRLPATISATTSLIART